MVAVPLQGYKVLFNHLPPVLLVPRELPSCAPGQLVRELFRRKSKRAPEGSFGTCGPARSRVLQSAVPCGEGDRGVAACHPPVDSECLRHGDEVSDGDHGVSIRVDQKRRLDVLHRPEGRLLPDSCPSGISAVSSLLSRETGLSVPCVVLRSVHGPTGVHQSSFWFQSGCIGGVCVYSITWTIGWSLRSRGIFCCSISNWFSSCVRIWGSSTGRSRISSPLLASSF